MRMLETSDECKMYIVHTFLSHEWGTKMNKNRQEFGKSSWKKLLVCLFIYLFVLFFFHAQISIRGNFMNLLTVKWNVLKCECAKPLQLLQRYVKCVYLCAYCLLSMFEYRHCRHRRRCCCCKHIALYISLNHHSTTAYLLHLRTIFQRWNHKQIVHIRLGVVFVFSSPFHGTL